MKMKNAITCLVACLCILCLSGCKKDLVNSSKESNGSEENFYKVNTLDFDISELDDDEYFGCDTICYKNGKIYYSTDMLGEIDAPHSYRIYGYSMENEMSEMLFSFEVEPDENTFPGNVLSLEVTDSEEIHVYFYSSIYDEATDSDYKHIDKYMYSSEGELLSTTSLENDTAISMATQCFSDSEGNIYVNTLDEETYAYNYIIRYDSQGKKTGKMELSNMPSVVISADNRMIYENTSPEGAGYAYIDIDNNKKDSAPFKELDKIEDINMIYSCYQDELYITGRTYMYSFNTKTQELSGLIKYSDVDIDPLNIKYFERLDEKSFLCINDIDINGRSEIEFLVLEETDEAEDNRTVVSVASIYENDSDIKNIINKFNKSNDEYCIEYTSYGMDGEDPIIAFNKDIASGNVPDIFLTDEMDVNNLINKGMLEDLTSFIEKDDVVNKDYFTEGYLEATNVDGKQYFLSKAFYLTTLCGAGKELEVYKDNPTAENLANYYNSKEKGTLLYEDAQGTALFHELAKGCIGDYIDTETGKCSFDSEAFRQLLGLCYAANVQGETYDEKPVAYKIKDREILFSNDMITTPYDIVNNNVLFDSDASYVGYPWSNGGVCLRSVGSTFAISSDSDNKEAAWAVIKEFLTGEYYRYTHEYVRNGDYIPVSVKEFDMLIKDSMVSSEYIAEDGEKVVYVMQTSELDTKLEVPEDEDIAVFRELIERAKYQHRRSYECEVILDDVENYLDDRANLDDTISVIQDKMTKYVNENR